MMILLQYYVTFLKKSNQKTKNIAYERVEISACRANDTLKHPHIYIYVILPCSITSRSVFNTIFLFHHSVLRFFYIPSMVVPSYTFNPLNFSFFLFSNARSFSFSSGDIHHSTILLRVSQRYVSLFE